MFVAIVRLITGHQIGFAADSEDSLYAVLGEYVSRNLGEVADENAEEEIRALLEEQHFEDAVILYFDHDQSGVTENLVGPASAPWVRGLPSPDGEKGSA